MRRPSQNAKQRQYARVQRALRSLSKAAVRYADAIDRENETHSSEAKVATDLRDTDLLGAALKFANTLDTRERRRLSK